ncbi:tetratricopeptide repeat protein, partial [Mycobacterium helveticum]
MVDDRQKTGRERRPRPASGAWSGAGRARPTQPRDGQPRDTQPRDT